MSVVLGGWGFGCVVTRGYGCPQPQVPLEDQVICDFRSVVCVERSFASYIDDGIEVLSLVLPSIEILSEASMHCDISSPIVQHIDLASPAMQVAVIDLESLITLVLNLSSSAGGCDSC